VSQGLEKTFEILGATRNEAAVAVLIPALDSPRPADAERALRALLKRRSPAGQREIVRRWHALSDAWKEIIRELPGRISSAIRDAIVGSDEQVRMNGCDAALVLQEYDLIPALLNAAEDEANPHAKEMAATLLELTQSLYELLSAPRDYSSRRDPQLVRQYVLQGLEASVRRYPKHKQNDIVEAFLLLAGRDNATLKQILRDPREPSFLAVIDALSRGIRHGALRLLLSYLDDPQAPHAVMNVITHRRDPMFLPLLLKKIGFEPSASAKSNLKRVEAIGWARDLDVLEGLDDACQHAAAQMVLYSGMKRLEVFEILKWLIEKGKPGGRRAATAALAEFRGAEANALVLKALEDGDPHVQAIALAQLRQRGIPGALARLVEMVESPHAAVRDAARASLPEFEFRRYLAAFDMLDDNVKRSTGIMVKKIDPTTTASLAEEMSAPARTRRLRALEAAMTIGAVRDLERRVVELLQDDDHMVRTAAARALAQGNSPAIVAALREARRDRSVAVQEEAQRSLEQIMAGHGRADYAALNLLAELGHAAQLLGGIQLPSIGPVSGGEQGAGT
jgi:HEAT repeat protein